MLQQRSKSDVGQPFYHSDLFSELDATSIRRLSVIGSAIGDDEDMNEEYFKLQAELNEQQVHGEEGGIVPGHASEPEHEQQSQEPEDLQTEEPLQLEQEQSEQTQDDALFQDAEEHLPQEIEDVLEPADIALPEGSDSGKLHFAINTGKTCLIEPDLEEDDISFALDPEELARNDSANGGKVYHDDSSSLYSTDESDIDVDSTTDVATVSTPRTASLLRADMMEYFDEKIPVLSEPSQVLPVIPAPGMAATSGPLENFFW
jgi:hypothetical protein